MSYTSFDHVADTVVSLGTGTLLAKVDIELAYRLIPVPHQWQDCIFVDPMLPFRIRSAPKTLWPTHYIGTSPTVASHTSTIISMISSCWLPLCLPGASTTSTRCCRSARGWVCPLQHTRLRDHPLVWCSSELRSTLSLGNCGFRETNS